MKITLISHACVVSPNQQKLVELARFPDLELALVAPTSWKDWSAGVRYRLDEHYGQGYQVIGCRTSTSWKSYFTFYLGGILRHIMQFRPDIVQIDEEPCTLACLQCLLYARLVGSKTVVFSFQDLPVRYPFPFSWVERRCLNLADYAIAGTEAVKHVLRGKGFGRGIAVIPHGFDPALYTKSDSTELRKRRDLRAFTIGYVGRLVKEKGLMLLLEAVADLDYDCQLLIVGEGPLHQEMIACAERLGIVDRLIFAGNVPHIEIPHYLSSMDALVLPSITTRGWREQLGRVLIEAMACEVPVIGSSSGEIPNVIGDAGLVFLEGSAEELRDKIEQLIVNEHLRRELAMRGKGRVHVQYTWKAVARQIHQVYQELVQE